MKLKRSERIVLMTEYLLKNPNKLIPLTYFVSKFNQAKSSISEDIHIIKDSFKEECIGTIKTLSGVNGGVVFYPILNNTAAREVVDEFLDNLKSTDRLLAGGYIYMSDIIGNPSLMNKLGLLIANIYQDKEVDAVVTVASKGIPVAYAVASVLNRPVVIIRRDNKVTEGTTVAINFVSGSRKKIETMVLSKRSLESSSKVLLVDDFLRGGGVMKGMQSLMKEFDVDVVGKAVLTQCFDSEYDIDENYTYLSRLTKLNEFTGEFEIESGNALQQLNEKNKNIER
ncbi:MULTISPECIES: pur operon repressor [unclassified Gemella]|uniref:pur operon repressor n=1 Tax=unclassified Gemella TaxID=2624949 RepID=UPI0010739857|nr:MULTISPECIES: pur operon repressor [unclassified Gemella]MBF0710555.1 pur operon repressor [Gemella sp. GL1.1]MBF0746276.1 pur operon repressor [Gemella sp. 19428wG2_WT2a]NYS27899.1 pur operon repressor [Gemella sp. GL1]TFU60554.1 pur operon repressor [Gemella sp. WT2a]